MDRWTRLKEGVAVVLHLRSSHDQVAGGLLKCRVLHRRRCDGSTYRWDGQQDNTTQASSE